MSTLFPCNFESEEAVQDPSAVMIERRTVTYQEIDVLAVGDQQTCRGQAANVFFTLENERCAAAISFNPPGAGSSKTGNCFYMFDFRHKFPAGKICFNMRARFIGKVVQRVDPRELMAIPIDQRDTPAGSGNGKCPYWNYTLVYFAVGSGKYQSSEGIATEGVV